VVRKKNENWYNMDGRETSAAIITYTLSHTHIYDIDLKKKCIYKFSMVGKTTRFKILIIPCNFINKTKLSFRLLCKPHFRHPIGT